MTETHSLGDWEKEFDERFDFFECSAVNETPIIDFIRKLLLAQKEGFRREIEGLDKSGVFHCSKCRDLVLTKLDTNGI